MTNKLKQLFYKQTEEFEYEFFEDKEFKIQIREKSQITENTYILSSDIAPLILFDKILVKGQILFTPYHNMQWRYKRTTTLQDITPNYSKYIPEDSVVVFLDEKTAISYCQSFNKTREDIILDECWYYIENKLSNPNDAIKKYALFLSKLTSKNIEKVNNIAKELKEKHKIEWVGVFTPLCFLPIEPEYLNEYLEYVTYLDKIPAGYYKVKNPKTNELEEEWCEEGKALSTHNKLYYINKLITTNATGIHEPQDTKLLKVIDCKEIFEDYLSNQ